MENFNKIENVFFLTGKVEDDTQNKCIRFFPNIEKPFEIDERNEIADNVEKRFKNHHFTGLNDFISSNKGVIEYKFYYQE